MLYLKIKPFNWKASLNIFQQQLQMAKDNVETVTGKNIRYILTELDQSDIFKVKKNYIKKKFKFAPIQPADEWKVQLVKEITDVKQNVLCIRDDQNGQFTPDELDEILNYVTTV